MWFKGPSYFDTFNVDEFVKFAIRKKKVKETLLGILYVYNVQV